MASKSSQLLLLFMLLFLTLVVIPSAAARVNPVNLQLIYPQIREIAKFAVSEFNKEFNKDLILENVIKGDFTEGLHDRIYRIYIIVKSMKNVPDSGEYVTFVQIDYLKHHRRELIAFHQLSH